MIYFNYFSLIFVKSFVEANSIGDFKLSVKSDLILNQNSDVQNNSHSVSDYDVGSNRDMLKEKTKYLRDDKSRLTENATVHPNVTTNNRPINSLRKRSKQRTGLVSHISVNSSAFIILRRENLTTTYRDAANTFGKGARKQELLNAFNDSLISHRSVDVLEKCKKETLTIDPGKEILALFSCGTNRTAVRNSFDEDRTERSKPEIIKIRVKRDLNENKTNGTLMAGNASTVSPDASEQNGLEPRSQFTEIKREAQGDNSVSKEMIVNSSNQNDQAVQQVRINGKTEPGITGRENRKNVTIDTNSETSRINIDLTDATFENGSTLLKNVTEVSSESPTKLLSDNEVLNLTAEFHLKSVKFQKLGEMESISPLFGRINDQKISVGIYLNRTENVHLGTLYGSRFARTSLKVPMRGENRDVEAIFKYIAEQVWPYDRTWPPPPVAAKFLTRAINQLGYVVDNSTESLQAVKDFISNFYFEDTLGCVPCFCSVFVKQPSPSAKPGEASLVCFTPKLTLEQSVFLYSDYHSEVQYLNISGYASLVSTLFLLVTVIVYLIQPDLRRIVYGKCVCLYVMSMFTSYLCTTLVVLIPKYLGIFCKLVGFTLQFSWLSCFFLQSVMCFDILSTFRKVRPLMSWKEDTRKRLACYVRYSYGNPGLLTLITVVLQFSPLLDDGNAWKPSMSTETCFFSKATGFERILLCSL